MSNYTKNTNFTAKDNLTSGDPAKVIKGAEFDTEFNSIQTAVNSKADSNNSQLTGSTAAQAITTTGDVTVGGNLAVTGNATISGNLTFGDADTDTVSFSADVNSNIIPDADATYDLGSPTKEWRNLYVDGTAHVDAINLNGTAVTATASELNITDGLTATTAELNVLDGITATTTELNYTDGVTSNIQTQLNTKAPIASPTFTGTTTIPTVDINGGTIDGVSITGTTASFSGEISANGGIALGDNDKATFGASDDLQIYHDGVHSVIADVGTGNLYLRGQSITMQNADGSKAYFGGSGDVATAYYGTNAKLATTATGVDVTGTVTADGLTVEGSSTGTLSSVNFLNTDTSANATGNRLGLGISNSSGANYTYIEAKETGVDNFAEMNFYTGVSPTKRMTIGTYGDVHLYEDTGTTAKFVWDSSAESLGIGVSDPIYNLEVNGEVGIELFSSDGTEKTLNFRPSLGDVSKYNMSITSYDHGGNGVGSTDGLSINGYDGVSICTGSSASRQERLRVNQSGNVGIGTISPQNRLHVAGNIRIDNAGYYVSETSTGGAVRMLGINSGDVAYVGGIDSGIASTIFNASSTSNTASFYTAGSERARIDSSGNLLVGKTSTNIAVDGVVLGTGSQSFTGTGGQYSYRITTNGGVGLHHFYSDVGGTQTLKSYVRTDGNYVQLSDYRLKENITPIENAVDKVNKLKPVTYTWKNTEGKEAHGFIAHEFKEVLPNEVDGDKDQVKEDGTPFYQAINVSSAIPLLVKAMQEQQEIIESLKTRIETLENK